MIALSALMAYFKSDVGTKKLRLWMMYLLIFLVVVFGSLTVTNYFKVLRQQIAISESQKAIELQKVAIGQLVTVNEQQQQAIDSAEYQRNLDGEILTGVQDDLHQLGIRDRNLNEKLATLEQRYAQVRQFNSTPVPAIPGGGCMLDNSCNAGDRDEGADPKPAETPSAKVPAADAGKSQRKP